MLKYQLSSFLGYIAIGYVKLGVVFVNCVDGGLEQILTWEDCKKAGEYFSKNVGSPGGADDSTAQGYGQNPPGCYLQGGTTYFNPVGYTNTMACSSWAPSTGGYENGACLCKTSGTY